jgi:putative peptidoglycan lipid II flippase
VTTARALPGIAGAAAAVAVVTLLARVVGLGRWLVFEGSVGSGWTGTAYAGANIVPNVLFEVVAGGALAASVVPVLASSMVRGDPDETARVASALLTWTVLVLTPVALALAVLARPVARLLLGAGAPAPVADSAGRMLLAFAPQVVLYGVGIVLTGVLQAHRRFLGPALAPLLSSVVVVGVYLAFAAATGSPGRPIDWLPGRAGEALLAWGTTAGVLVLSLPLLVPVHRAGVRLRPTLRLDPAVARRVRTLAAAGLAGLVAQQCLVLVTARLATSSGGVGALNVYQYTQAVYLLPYAVLAVPLATAAFPVLAGHAAASDGDRYASVLVRSTRAVVLVGLAGAAVLVAVAPAVGAVFTALRGGSPALRAMPVALVAYAPGLVGFALIAHLGRALLAADAARWAARSTVAGWGTAVLLSVLLVPALAGPGTDPSTDPSTAARATLLALGISSSAGMTVAGGLLLVGAARLRVGTVRVAQQLSGSAPVVLRFLAVAAVAVAAGRFGTDWALGSGPGSGPAGPALLRSVVAGAAGAAVAGAVLAGGLALVARDDLRSLRPARWRA